MGVMEGRGVFCVGGRGRGEKKGKEERRKEKEETEKEEPMNRGVASCQYVE
jgi:hypothetical protein